MPLNEIQCLLEVQKPSQKPLCSVGRFFFPSFPWPACLFLLLSASSPLEPRAASPLLQQWHRKIAPREEVSSWASRKVSPDTVTPHKGRQPASWEHALQQMLSTISMLNWNRNHTTAGTRRWDFCLIYCGVLNTTVFFFFSAPFPCVFTFIHPHSFNGRVSTTPLPPGLLYSMVPSSCGLQRWI